MSPELKLFLEAAEVGAMAYEKRSAIKKAFMRVWNLLQYGKENIAIFGPPGAGKSTLGRFLSGNSDERTASGGYVASDDVEVYSFDSSLPAGISALPGQERLRGDTWTTIQSKIASGKIGGLINVVAYGYETIDFDYRKHVLYKEGMAKDDFLAAYLDNRRREELNIVKILRSRIEDAPGKLWMITIVTKQDLWWDKRYDVQKHYCEGEYSQVIDSIIESKGRKSANFKHRFLSASLQWNSLRDGEGELLFQTASGYEQRIRAGNLIRVSTCIESLIRNS